MLFFETDYEHRLQNKNVLKILIDWSPRLVPISRHFTILAAVKGDHFMVTTSFFIQYRNMVVLSNVNKRYSLLHLVFISDIFNLCVLTIDWLTCFL